MPKPTSIADPVSGTELAESALFVGPIVKVPLASHSSFINPYGQETRAVFPIARDVDEARKILTG
jgi:hypothetical protein